MRQVIAAVPRGVLREVEFSGLSAAAGAPVRLALAASQLLPHVFADPQRFKNPDRFARRQRQRRSPHAVWAGHVWWRRVSASASTSPTSETKALAVHVLRHYRLAAVEGQ